MKKLFIIPGFKQKATDDAYRWIKTVAKKSDWHVVAVPITWNHRTLSQNTEEFISFFNKHKVQHNQILGFSYGAVIAFLSAATTNPDHLHLCSLSPDFEEDQAKMPLDIQYYIGKRRYADILTRNAKSIAEKITAPTTIYYGSIEASLFPQLKNRAERTAKDLRAKLIEINGAPHQIDHPEYKKAILDNLAL
jgi:pimeloyl-ACP methyl ester carboxylesterase